MFALCDVPIDKPRERSRPVPPVTARPTRKCIVGEVVRTPTHHPPHQTVSPPQHHDAQRGRWRKHDARRVNVMIGSRLSLRLPHGGFDERFESVRETAMGYRSQRRRKMSALVSMWAQCFFGRIFLHRVHPCPHDDMVGGALCSPGDESDTH